MNILYLNTYIHSQWKFIVEIHCIFQQDCTSEIEIFVFISDKNQQNSYLFHH